MRTLRIMLFGIPLWLIGPLTTCSQPEHTNTTASVSVVWENARPEGTVEVRNGDLDRLTIAGKQGSTQGDRFHAKAPADVRLTIALTQVNIGPGSNPTIVTVKTSQNPFSFLLRDVSQDCPIFIPEYHVAVTTAADPRSYGQIAAAIMQRGLRTKLQHIDAEPEEIFATAAARTRDQACPTWLGISRDMHIFELSDGRTDPTSEMDIIRPRDASVALMLPEFKNRPAEYGYVMGRGRGVAIRMSRWLEDGTLPILHSTTKDDDIEYHATAFVTLERSPLTDHTAFGTDFLVADASCNGHMLTKEQQAQLVPKLDDEQCKTESTVLYLRVAATNTAAIPRYAWFKTLRPGSQWWMKADYAYDRASGFSSFPSGNVFGISMLNGSPLPDEEMAVLLKPGETAIFAFVMPHRPVPKARALDLARQSFESRYDECKRFWKDKLRSAAQVHLPEKRINDMVQAGLLQLDLVTYGIEPGGVLAPTIGFYSPIGTESSPIIQFYASMGWSDVALRSLSFFLEKQHDDGMIQNFNGYMVETGAALWSMGEYYRYTRDTAWVRRSEQKLVKACDYLLRWRADDIKTGGNAGGQGMIAGKVADPNDPYHQYMLNAYAYLGLKRAAEMLKDVDPPRSAQLAKEAAAWKQDIRAALMTSMANAPVVPLGDGRWSPTVPPWTEAIGPRALHLSPDTYFSHGTITAADALLGSLSLVFCEVLAPDEPVSRMMLDYQSELFYEDNTAFSQPYYSRHDWLQLKLGLVKPFLKTYYNAFSALSDRETYAFWEHVFQVSPHKTHEQAWFLMQTRWMLYLEEGQTLRLLSGIPRRWMEDGGQIDLENVRSYFGPLSIRVESKVHTGIIEANISCPSRDRPRTVILRLPHPEGKKATRVTGGTYDATSESILINDFTGTAKVIAVF